MKNHALDLQKRLKVLLDVGPLLTPLNPFPTLLEIFDIVKKKLQVHLNAYLLCLTPARLTRLTGLKKF